jgi:hypothetical protein
MLGFQTESLVSYISYRTAGLASGSEVVATRRKTPQASTEMVMPSLFRFLVLFGLLGGLAYGAVFSLATFVKFKPREIIVTIPPDKFIKNH